MKFYEINETLRAITEAYENGELEDDVYRDTLEGLEMAQDDKLEHIACLYKERVAEADAVKVEAKKLSDRSSSIAKTADNLKNFLSSCMETANKDKFKTARVQIGFRKSKYLDVFDALAYQDYAEKNGYIKTIVSVDNAAIKKCIEDGTEVDGAKISERQNIQVK